MNRIIRWLLWGHHTYALVTCVSCAMVLHLLIFFPLDILLLSSGGAGAGGFLKECRNL